MQINGTDLAAIAGALATCVTAVCAVANNYILASHKASVERGEVVAQDVRREVSALSDKVDTQNAAINPPTEK